MSDLARVALSSAALGHTHDLELPRHGDEARPASMSSNCTVADDSFSLILSLSFGFSAL